MRPVADNLRWARQYADRGWRVLPVEAGGKRPLLNDWPNRASSDFGQLTRWFAGKPLLNVGLLIGPESGLAALDFEAEPDGYAAWRADGLRDLDTLTSLTASGGRHWLVTYAVEFAVRAVRARAGMDLLGARSYIVAPPSRTEKGSYRWQAWPAQLAPFPADCFDGVPISSGASSGGPYPARPRPADALLKRQWLCGERDECVFNAALTLLAAGMPADEVRQRVERLVLRRCESPEEFIGQVPEKVTHARRYLERRRAAN